MAISKNTGILARLRDVFRPAPQKAGPAPAPKAPPAPQAKPQPWGSTLFADYHTGAVTSEKQSRGKDNIPLYYDAKANKLTNRQTEVPAYFGLTADLDDDMRLALKAMKAQQDLALKKLQEAQKPSPYLKPQPRVETPASSGYSPDFSRYQAKQVRETLVGAVQELDRLFRSGAIDTPEGRARQNEILQLYAQYAPAEPDLIRTETVTGKPIAIEVAGRRDEKSPIITEVQKQTVIQGLTAINPTLGAVMRAVTSAGDALARVAPGLWGGRFTQDIDALTSMFRSTFEDWTEKSPIFHAAWAALPVASDTIAAPNLTGAIGLAWSESVKLVHSIFTGEEVDLKESAVSIARSALSGLNPIAYGIHGVLDLASIATGRDYGDLATFHVLGIPFSEWIAPETDERLARRNARLRIFRQAIGRLRSTPIDELLDFKGGAVNLDIETISRMEPENRRRLIPDDDFKEMRQEYERNQQIVADQEGQLALLGELRHSLELSRSVNNVELNSELTRRISELAIDLWQGQISRTDTPSYSWRYSWDWAGDGDVRRAASDKAVADFIAQTGRMPLPFEVFSITDRFVAAGPEFVGEAAFDPLNLIPVAFMDTVFLKPIKSVAKGVWEVTGAVLGRRFVTWAEEFFVNGAIASNAIRQGNNFNDMIIVLARFSGDDTPEFYRVLQRLLEHLEKPAEVAINDLGIPRRVLRRFQDALGALDNKTVDQIMNRAADLLRSQGRAETPRNLATVLPNVIQEVVLRNNTLKGFYATGALDEGLIAALRRKGLIPDGSFRKGMVEMWLRMERTFRRAWTPLILTGRPGYSVINHLDNAFRAAIHGVNATMNFNSILRDLGPLVSSQIKGGFGAHLDESVANVADRIVAGELRADLLEIWIDGFKSGKGLGRWINAWGQVNAASEFMWRARTYHRFRSQIMEVVVQQLDQLLPNMAAYNALDDLGKDIVREALRVAQDDPVLLRRLISGEAGVWSRLLPADQYEAWVRAFGEEGARGMAKRLTTQLRTMIENGQLTPENIDLLFDDMVEESRTLVQDAMQHAEDLARGRTDDVIQPGLGAEAVPEEGLTSRQLRLPQQAVDRALEVQRVGISGSTPDPLELEIASLKSRITSEELNILNRGGPEADALRETIRIREEEAGRRIEALLTNKSDDELIGVMDGLNVDRMTRGQRPRPGGERGPDYAAQEWLRRHPDASIDPYQNPHLWLSPEERRARDLLNAQRAETAGLVPVYNHNPDAPRGRPSSEWGTTQRGFVMTGVGENSIGGRQGYIRVAYLTPEQLEAGRAAAAAADAARGFQQVSPEAAEHMVFLEGSGVEWLPEGSPPPVGPIAAADAITGARFYQTFEQEWQALLDRMGIESDEIPAGDVAELQQFARQVKDTAGQELARENALFYQALDARLAAASEASDAAAVQGVAQLTQIEGALDKLWRRNLREFAANVYPGPWRFRGRYSAQAVRQYFEVEAMALSFHAEQTRALRGILERDAWDEIASLPISTRAEFFQRIGWEFIFDDEGRLTRFRLPGGSWNQQDVGAARTAFNFNTEDDFNNLPLIEGRQPSTRFRQVPEAGVSEQNLRDMAVSAELWQTVLDRPRTGVGASNRGLIQALFGPEAVDSPEEFARLAAVAFEEARAVGDIAKAKYIRSLILEVEADLNAMRYVEGLADFTSPAPLQLHRVSSAVQSKLRASGGWIEGQAMYEALLNGWRQHLHNALQTGDIFVRNLAPGQAEHLASVANDLQRVMTEALDVADHGGSFMGIDFDGAINQMNKIMIDYQNYGQLDRFIKDNIYPFWMFPSRSIPMWIQTLVQKPWLGSLYGKYLHASERISYERGATTRRGRQLPSLKGHIPLPGTDIWFNPLAPFSIRYLFPDVPDDYGEDQNETVPQKFFNWIIENSRTFGMFPHPFILIGLAGFDLITENRVPKFALIPQAKLIPPWWEKAVVREMRKYGPLGRFGADLIDPEVTWYDFLVERRILRNALDEITHNGNLTPEQKLRLAEQARSAIDISSREQDENMMKIWEDARSELDNEQWVSGLVGFFTSFYGKPFTTADAEMILVRREIDTLKQALNDEVVANIFEFDPNVVDRYEHYTNMRYQTPEGFISNTYDKISFVRNEEGTQVYGDERLKIISQLIHEEQQKEAYYDGIKIARAAFEAALNVLPIGSTMAGDEWEKYFATLARLDKLYPSAQRSTFVGYKPEFQVYNDIVGDIWAGVRSSSPQFDPSNETWGEYQQRYDQWLNSLPEAADRIVAGWLHVNIAMPATKGLEPPIQFLAPNLNFPKDLRNRLVEEITPENYQAWQKANDTEWEALDSAWETLYWDQYWKAVQNPETGEFLPADEFRLAEQKFLEGFGEGGQPSPEQLIEWVQQNYPGRFEVDALRRVMRPGGVYSIEDRQIESKGEGGAAEERLWDLLARVDPGAGYGAFMDTLEGIDPKAADDLNAWYVTGGNSQAWSDPTRFDRFVESVAKAVEQMGLPEPNAARLEERISARKLNEQFLREAGENFGEDISSFVGQYMNMSREQRADFREQFPDAYARIPAYFDFRDQFAIDNPLWAKYYRREVYDAVAGGQTLADAVAGIGIGTGGGRGGIGRGGGGVSAGGGISRSDIPRLLRAGFRGAESGEELLRRGLGKGGVAARPLWPQWLLDSIGEAAVAAVEKAADLGSPIPSSTVEYLKNLDANSPRNIEAETRRVYEILVGSPGTRPSPTGAERKPRPVRRVPPGGGGGGGPVHKV